MKAKNEKYYGVLVDSLGSLPSFKTHPYPTWEQAQHAAEKHLKRLLSYGTQNRFFIHVIEKE